LWTKKDVEEEQKKGSIPSRLKGLGELDPWMLKICAIDEKTRKLIKINYTKNIDKMLEYFQGSEKKRELLSDNDIMIGV
jgi:DNA gyrase/topoisomerase IV subunit B